MKLCVLKNLSDEQASYEAYLTLEFQKKKLIYLESKVQGRGINFESTFSGSQSDHFKNQISFYLLSHPFVKKNFTAYKAFFKLSV